MILCLFFCVHVCAWIYPVFLLLVGLFGDGAGVAAMLLLGEHWGYPDGLQRLIGSVFAAYHFILPLVTKRL